MMWICEDCGMKMEYPEELEEYAECQCGSMNVKPYAGIKRDYHDIKKRILKASNGMDEE